MAILALDLDVDGRTQRLGQRAEEVRHQFRGQPADLGLMEVVGVFLRSRYRRFPVLEDQRPVGILSRRDVLSAALSLL